MRLKELSSFVIFVAIMILLSGCLGAPLVREKGGVKPPEEEEVEKAQQELGSIDLQELPPIKKEVRKLHVIMNNLTGWGQLSKYNNKSDSGWGSVASYLAGENSIVDRVHDMIN